MLLYLVHSSHNKDFCPFLDFASLSKFLLKVIIDFIEGFVQTVPFVIIVFCQHSCHYVIKNNVH